MTTRNLPIDDATFIAMEAGSQWPAWIESGASTRVIVRQGDEDPERFATRVADRIEVLRASGYRIDRALVACSERRDEHVRAARRDIARALLSAGDDPELLFTANECSAGSARHALSSLVADLNHEWEDAGAAISVRFGLPSVPPQTRDGGIKYRHVA